MRQKKVVFGEKEIIEFCSVTKDTNQIHNPEIMAGLGKQVIVPGMLALSFIINLSAEFLKTKANAVSVHFNSFINSGDTVILGSLTIPGLPGEIKLSAIHKEDTLASKDGYSRIHSQLPDSFLNHQGSLQRIEVTNEQVEKFSSLIGATDPDVARFLFAVAYASHALLKCIRHPKTEVEKEIDQLINSDRGVSPFYHALRIGFPSEFPVFNPEGSLDYFVHFEREKKNRLYIAHLRCECSGKIVFHARYNLKGIADAVIIRMAKEIQVQANPV